MVEDAYRRYLLLNSILHKIKSFNKVNILFNCFCPDVVYYTQIIWCEGKQFWTQWIDGKINTQYYGIIASFERCNGAMLDYCGIIQDIIKLDF